VGGPVEYIPGGKLMTKAIKVKAPAKINLTLEVLGKRADGYHEITSILQTLSLCDTLYLEAAEETTFRCNSPAWSADKSLIIKVIQLLKNITASTNNVTVKIEKELPLLSGLGGDSSDAAALLRGLNELWKLGLSTVKLKELAAQLGSDVAFFLQGGTALVKGRGEIITPLTALPEMWVVLIMPDMPSVPGKTGRMYAALKPGHFTDGRITEKFASTLHKGTVDSAMLFNTFENIAFDYYPGLSGYKEHLIKLGAHHVHLAGSGPALFTMFSDKARAEELCRTCNNQGMKSYLASTGFNF
jgi:4-diphosphocytidyl-2-C-methyl-D-erythritol kinase